MKIEFDLLKDLFFVPVIAAWKKKKEINNQRLFL